MLVGMGNKEKQKEKNMDRKVLRRGREGDEEEREKKKSERDETRGRRHRIKKQNPKREQGTGARAKSKKRERPHNCRAATSTQLKSHVPTRQISYSLRGLLAALSNSVDNTQTSSAASFLCVTDVTRSSIVSASMCRCRATFHHCSVSTFGGIVFLRRTTWLHDMLFFWRTDRDECLEPKLKGF